MAIVSGLTAERMKELAGLFITDARINENYELIFTTAGGTDINIGNIRGPIGEDGPAGSITKINGRTGPEINLTVQDFGVDLSGLVPVGTILATGRSTAAAGYLLCQGQAVSRTGANTALFSAIGTSYGIGNGVDTMNLPDLRGRVPVGRDVSQTEFDVLGETGGSKTQTLSVANLPAHKHDIDPNSTSATTTNKAQDTSSGITTDNGGKSMASGFDTGRYGRSVSIDGATENTGGGTAHNNLQPFQVINYMIKL